MEQFRLSPTQKVATVSLFTALAVATDYAMLPLTNVKLMDSIIFVSALVFGLGVGVSVAALTWLVYGSVNPFGSAGSALLIILIVSETIYAFLGLVARRSLSASENGIPARSLFWGLLGLIGALIYDVSTIVPPALISGVPPTLAVLSLLPAIPFMLAHEISDFVFFAIVGPTLVSAILRIRKPNGIRLNAKRADPLVAGEGSVKS